MSHRPRWGVTPCGNRRGKGFGDPKPMPGFGSPPERPQRRVIRKPSIPPPSGPAVIASPLGSTRAYLRLQQQEQEKQLQHRSPPPERPSRVSVITSQVRSHSQPMTRRRTQIQAQCDLYDPDGASVCDFVAESEEALQEHKEEHCLYRHVRCNYCMEVLLRRDEALHLRTCQAIEVACPLGCQLSIPRKDLVDHIQQTLYTHSPEALKDATADLPPDDPAFIISMLLEELQHVVAELDRGPQAPASSVGVNGEGPRHTDPTPQSLPEEDAPVPRCTTPQPSPRPAKGHDKEEKERERERDMGVDPANDPLDGHTLQSLAEQRVPQRVDTCCRLVDRFARRVEECTGKVKSGSAGGDLRGLKGDMQHWKDQITAACQDLDATLDKLIVQGMSSGTADDPLTGDTFPLLDLRFYKKRLKGGGEGSLGLRKAEQAWYDLKVLIYNATYNARQDGR